MERQLELKPAITESIDQLQERLIGQDYFINEADLIDPESEATKNLESLLHDLTVKFMQLDTNTVNMPHLDRAFTYITTLLEPLEDQLDIEMIAPGDIGVAESIQRPMLFIGSKGINLQEKTDDLKLKTLRVGYGVAISPEDLVKFDCTILHAHLDTIPVFGGLRTILTDGNIIEGRGSNDMLGQVAILMALIYQLTSKGKEFCVVFTTDEEQAGVLGGNKGAHIDADLIIDLEPLPIPNAFSGEIAFENNFNIKFFGDINENKLPEFERRVREHFGLSNPEDFYMVLNSNRNISLSLLCNEEYMSLAIRNIAADTFKEHVAVPFRTDRSYKTNLNPRQLDQLNELFTEIPDYAQPEVMINQKQLTYGRRTYGKMIEICHNYATWATFSSAIRSKSHHNVTANNAIILGPYEYDRHGRNERVDVRDLSTVYKRVLNIIRKFNPLSTFEP